MDYVLEALVGSVVSWLLLLLIVPIAQKMADFSMPPWSQALWQLAVVAVATSVVTVALDQVNGFLSWIGSAIVFWILMVKWFDVDFFGAVCIVVLERIAAFVLLMVIFGLFAG